MSICEACGHDGMSTSRSHDLQKRQPRPPPEYTSKMYQALPRHRGYIRLLNVRGSSADNPNVECELLLRKFMREDTPATQNALPVQPYEALSWCWGKAKAKSHILIRRNGMLYAKYVSSDLLAALKALRYTKTDRYLWVDAVCIDQENTKEKNHQVEMMSEIYGKANRVCIWLGDGDKSSRMALQFIKKEVLQLQNFDELCESEQASEKWGALLELMQRPWFSRRWVVQEIALARQAMMYCGSDRISWKKFAVAVELFVEVETATHRLSEVMKKDPKFYHVPRWFEYVSALGASLLVEATGKLFRDYKPNGPLNFDSESDSDSDSETSESEIDSSSDYNVELASDSGSSFGSTSEDMRVQEHTPSFHMIETSPIQPLLSLEYLVSSLSIFDATVPHDTIYSLLAIAKDTSPSASQEGSEIVLDHTKAVLEIFTEKKSYNVDYGLPFVDVCREFVQFCIDHSDQSRALDIICRPWAPDTMDTAANRNDFSRKAKKKEKKKSTIVASGLTKKGKTSTNLDEKRIDTQEIQQGSDHKLLPLQLLLTSRTREGNVKQRKFNASIHDSNARLAALAGRRHWFDPSLPDHHWGGKIASRSTYHFEKFQNGLRQDHKFEDQDHANANGIPIPSWIPKLTGAAYAMYSQAGVHEMKMGRQNADTLVGLPPSNQSLMRNYNAAQTKMIDLKSLKFRRRSSMRHYSMYVKGFILDTILEVQPSSQGGAIPREWAIAAKWKNAPDTDPPDEFWRTLVADRGRDGRNPPVYYSRACKESFFKGGLSSGRVDTTDLISNERCSVVAQFCRRVQSVIWNRSLIRTENTKRMGLANQNAQPADYICILYGCSVPVTLRLKEKSPDMIDKEVEEEICHYQYGIASRIAKNHRRAKAFLEKRISEMKKYKKWDEQMDEEWQRDTKWRKSWNAQLQNGNKDGHSQNAVARVKLISTSKSRSAGGPPNPSKSDSSGPEQSSVESANKIDFSHEPTHPQTTQTSHNYEETTIVESAPMSPTNQYFGLQRNQSSILPSAIRSLETKKRNSHLQDEERMKQRKLWLEEEEKERPKRKEFTEWKKARRERLKKEEKAGKKHAQGNDPGSVKGSSQEILEEPNVDWYVFERFLKYGRRWKQIVRDKKNIRRWSGERFILCKSLKSDDAETYKENWAKVEAQLRKRKFFRFWKYIVFHRKSDRARWHAEYLIFCRKNQGDSEQEAIKRRVLNRLEKRSKLELRTDEDKNMLDKAISTPSSLTAEEQHARILCDDYVERMRFEIKKRYHRREIRQLTEEQKDEFQDPQELKDKIERMEEDIHKHNMRVADNVCYYEFLGESYIHGMMDGEAMAYQNENGLGARIFELR